MVTPAGTFEKVRVKRVAFVARPVVEPPVAVAAAAV
jgi:hypothetical protein